MLDNAFGQENLESQIIIQSNKRGQTYKSVAKTHEYLFAYDCDSETILMDCLVMWKMRNAMNMPYMNSGKA